MGQAITPRRCEANSAGAVPARRVRGCLVAAVLTMMVVGVSPNARHEAVRDRDAGVFRPGGMTLGETEHAFGHDASSAAGTVPGCLKVGETDRGSDTRIELSRLFEILSTSDTGRAVLKQARSRGVHVCVDGQTELLAYYFATQRVVGISASLSEGGKLAFLAHELAHVPQHPAHSDNRFLAPQELILLRRVREATAEAIASRIAWELRVTGYPDAWDEKMASSYADVARAFEAEAEVDDSEDGLLVASRAAFDRWFEAPWRRDVYDRMTLRHLARISADSLGLVPRRYIMTHSFLTEIAWIDGRNFLSETGSHPLTDSIYAGQMSSELARRLEPFLSRTTLSVPSSGVSPVSALES